MPSISFKTDDICSWPIEIVDALTSAGLLKEGELAGSVLCDGCEEGCIEEVVFADSKCSGASNAYIVCTLRDDIGRVAVPASRLRTLYSNPDFLANWLSAQLRSQAQVETVVNGRLWWLGGPDIHRRRADIFLACGVEWPDAPLVFGREGRVQECSSPIVLVPNQIPTNHPLGLSAKFASLRRLLHINETQPILDIDEIATIVGISRVKRIQNIPTFRTPPGTKWSEVYIKFVSEETVIITSGNVTETKSFAEMGFADLRKVDEPDKLWLLLRFMALHDGRLGWDDNLLIDDITKRKKQVSDIRKRLRSYFGIQEDPFNPYFKEGAYRAKFVILDLSKPR